MDRSVLSDCTGGEAVRYYTDEIRDNSVQVLLGKYTSKKSTSIPRRLVQDYVQVFFVISYSQDVRLAEKFGFIGRSSLNVLACSDFSNAEYISVPRSWCKSEPLAYRSIHPSFDNYKPMELIGELTLSDISTAVVNRLVLYQHYLEHRTLEHYPFIDTLFPGTDTDLQADSLAYYLVLSVLYSREFTRSHAGIFRQCQAEWLEIEKALSHYRIRYMQPAAVHAVVPEAVNETDVVPERIAAYLKQTCPLEKKFYLVPFSSCCSLLKDRKIVLDHGIGYVSASQLRQIAEDMCVSQHRTNVDRCRRQEMHINDKRLLKLMTSFGNRFAGFLQHKQAHPVGHCSVEEVRNNSPLCMQRYEKMAFDLGVADHLKNNDRIMYGAYLLANGVAIQTISKSFEPKMLLTYGTLELPSRLRELNGTLEWLQRNETKKAYSHDQRIRCTTLMLQHQCPYTRPDKITSEGDSAVQKAKKCCITQLHKRRPHLRVEVQNLKSPYNYIHFSRDKQKQ